MHETKSVVYLQADTSRVVYSWNDNTPTVTRDSDGEVYSLVPHQEKGSASLNLLSGLPNEPEIPDDALQFTVQVDDVSIILHRHDWYNKTDFMINPAYIRSVCKQF